MKHRQFIPGGTKIEILKSQSGNILVIMTVLVLLLALVFAGLVEFGRIMLVREQLQTAADAASLAGAGSGVHRYVKINVVTKRGMEQPPCDETCPPCYECGTETISGIWGDEKKLLDEGQWRKFCLPYCNCGGGDCWYELLERDVMFDTHSAEWGTTQGEIERVRSQMTDSIRRMLIMFGGDSVARMLEGRSLESIAFLLSNRDFFTGSWCSTNGTPCGFDPFTGKVKICCNPNAAENSYDRVSRFKDAVDNMKQTLQNLERTNSNQVDKVDMTVAGAAGRFFKANTPPHADDSWIDRIKVYGYEQRNSPYYPSVVVYASSKIKSLFPRFFGTEYYDTPVCSQSATFYRDPSDQIQQQGENKFYNPLDNLGRWRRLPEEACWVE